ncbi:hypothetical protein OAA19_01100 [Rubripirellula sp.]|nr:hypothetical protein [Rubripirellula sp.]MDB4338684.1 hypothetical protein [Rubripirellula sp.]
MKMNSLLGILTLLLSFGLSGCGSDDLGEAESTEATSNEATSNEATENAPTADLVVAPDDLLSLNDPPGGGSDSVNGESSPRVELITDEGDLGLVTDERFGELFEDVLPILEDARDLVDQHADLPDKSRIPFTEDKQTNSAAINELLDAAIVVLGSSEVSDYRQQIRDSNELIRLSHESIADYRRQRVSARWARDQTQLDKVNPFELSKEAIDQQIKDEEKAIDQQEEQLIELKRQFAKELAAIGVVVDEEAVESLLSSVSGDDIVSMAVVFENIKNITTQLQRLTQQSGEALDVSKRYYGMYVVMVHVMDRIQKSFVRDVREKHIPKLKQFSKQADENIAQARSIIEINGGDPVLLAGNIESNKLTQETAVLYIDYLQRNAALIEAENRRSQKNLATAMNTYNTVKLSSDVASLMKTGRRDFEALMKLEIPPLREFGNESIRREFERMTVELRTDL